MIFVLFIFSITYHTVLLDGNLDRFQQDELVYQDSPSDSYWSGNELFGVYCTWDRNNLYIGVSYKVQNNALLLLLDPGRNRGVNDINNLDWYPRNFQFYGMNADIICALWNADIYTGGVREILAKDRTQPLRGVEIVNNGISGDSSSLMLKIPFSAIYGTNSVPKGATLKLVALISGSDHSIGGDAIPDYESVGISSAVRRYLQISIDSNRDSIPDDSVSVSEVTEVITYPKIQLALTSFDISPLNIEGDVPLTISFSASDYSFAKVYVVSENGKRVYEKYFDSLIPGNLYTILWQPSSDLPQGIYFVIINLNDIVSRKKAFFLTK